MAMSMHNLCTPCAFVSMKEIYEKGLGLLPLCYLCLGSAKRSDNKYSTAPWKTTFHFLLLTLSKEAWVG